MLKLSSFIEHILCKLKIEIVSFSNVIGSNKYLIWSFTQFFSNWTFTIYLILSHQLDNKLWIFHVQYHINIGTQDSGHMYVCSLYHFNKSNYFKYLAKNCVYGESFSLTVSEVKRIFTNDKKCDEVLQFSVI